MFNCAECVAGNLIPTPVTLAFGLINPTTLVSCFELGLPCGQNLNGPGVSISAVLEHPITLILFEAA